jgi:LCCL domain
MSRISHVARRVAVTLLGMALPLISSSASAAGLRWTGVRHECLSTGRGQVTARLDGIPAFQSWENTCAGKIAGQVPPAMSKFGAAGLPQRCEKDLASTGIWGKWIVENDKACPSPLRWEGFGKAGCFGPNRQVYSARLMGSRSRGEWRKDCAATDTAKVGGRENWGKPNRCATDALQTGMWGEWYRDEGRCEVPLKWGSFKDNGCAADLEGADANAGGISLAGKRSYSSVLYNVGGDWLEACRFAPATFQAGASGRVEFERPTSCVLADADRALNLVLGSAFGAAAALVPMPPTIKGKLLVGAATGAVSAGAGDLILNVSNTNLNVWGVFWVDDASCGAVHAYTPVDGQRVIVLGTGQVVHATAPAPTSASARTAVFAGQGTQGCPDTAVSLRGTGQTVSCLCAASQATGGQVWGSGPYTDDSSICRAAVHAGVILVSGGAIRFRVSEGLSGYQGSQRNGVITSVYGPWHGSVIFDTVH